MIVVMPAGHAVPFGTQGKNNDLFESYLIKEVIPAVEATYRVAPGTANRALAGLSMGGGHTITPASRTRRYSALWASSAPGLPRDFDAAALHPKIPLVWVACGDIDTTVQYARVNVGGNARQGGREKQLQDLLGGAYMAGVAYEPDRFCAAAFSGSNMIRTLLLACTAMSLWAADSPKAEISNG